MAYISYHEALRLIKETVITQFKTKKVFLSDALGYVLAEDIYASCDSPQYPTSSMDGYAILHADQADKKLFIASTNPAGSMPQQLTAPKSCIKVFTGSLLPIGSDTVIPIENVCCEEGYIVIKDDVPKGFAVRCVGENYQKNELLIAKNTKIDFAHIGVLASLNRVFIPVYEKPVLSICATGSEIIDLGEEQIHAAQIRSSNHLTLEAIAKKYQLKTIQMGIVRDDKQAIFEAIENALAQSDIVVTTGGVSVGDFDFVKDVAKQYSKAKLIFHGVAIKPGQHILVVQIENKFIVGLPGFAYSSTVTFLLFVLALSAKFEKQQSPIQIAKATLAHDLPSSPKTTFIAAKLSQGDQSLIVDSSTNKIGSSAILTNLLESNALIIQEANTDCKRFDTVDVIVL